MKKTILLSSIILLCATLFSPINVEAKSSKSYYKSAKTGRFVSPSYSSSHKSTTYKSYRR